MKKQVFALAVLAIITFCLPAAALELPSVTCFSPGLVRVNEAVGNGADVDALAEFTVNNAFYVRDLSVLSDMLSGTVLHYTGTREDAGRTDRLQISRNGEELASLALTEEDAGAAIEINGLVYGAQSMQEIAQALVGGQADDSLFAQAMSADAFLTGMPILERAALSEIADWLEGLSAGDAVIAGFSVTQPFEVRRTMSDDGERLTRIDVSGAVGRDGEEPWVVAGFLRQPAGRAPKDTFEITFTQDKNNYFELLYSALHEATVTRKDKAGEVNVTTTLKAAGKLEGSSISSRLSVRMKNAWTSDGENLDEKITLTWTLTHQDKTPGRRMQRLNAVEAKLKNVITLTTGEEDTDFAYHDNVTLNIEMDSNTFADLAASVDVSVGEPAEREDRPAQILPADEGEIEQAMQEAVVDMAQKLYMQLGESSKEKIRKDL